MIDANRLLAESFIRRVEWLDQLDSTNDLALKWIAVPSAPIPFLIGTDEQTAGRGRGANRWWGAPGALMFSMGIDMPNLGVVNLDWPRFSLITGLAISETLLTFLPSARVGLKWPNDVWLDRRKVSGILIEQGERTPNRLVVGIGLNVNNSFAEAPDEQRRVATSMKDAGFGESFCRTEVLITFLTRWRRLVQQLADGEVNLVEHWSHLCVLSGHPVTLTNGNQEMTGTCAGIDDDGALLLRTAFSLERCYAGTVRLLD